MSEVSVCVELLGKAQVCVGGKAAQLSADKRTALLVYLAYAGDWVGRDRLAFLFWPEMGEAEARRNLRQLVKRTRLLSYATGFEVEVGRLRWVVDTDVAAFRAALARGDWCAATARYRGKLLEGLELPENGGFGAWLQLEREALHNAFRNAVLHQVEELSAQGRFAEAAEALERLLQDDPLAEDVLQSYLKNLYLAGRRDVALGAYRRFAERLESELGLTPLETTETLVATIRRAEPLAVPGVAAARPAVPVTVLRPPRLVGRAPELAALQAATTPLVLVSGEPGVGKTRFLLEAVPQAAWCACLEGLQNVPYHPVVALIRKHLESLPDLGLYRKDLAWLVPEVAPDLKPSALEPQTAKTRLLEALLRLKASLNLPIIVDDLQWADPASLELLLYSASRGGVRCYGSYRSGEEGPALRDALSALRAKGLVTEIHLRPLDENDLQVLLADLIGTDRGPQLFSRWLYKGTGGNPMFVLESLRALFESGVLRADAKGWHTAIDEVTCDYSELELPPAIAQVVERRVSRLSEKSRRVLQAASVVGEGFTSELLGRVTGLSEWATVEALEEAEAAAITQGSRFRHDLLRQSIYRALSEPRRKLLHGKVAEALEGEAEPLVVAEHWLSASHLAKAHQLWLQAAGELRKRALYREAITVLERALHHPADPEMRWALQTELAGVYQEIAEQDKAEALLKATLDNCRDPHTRARALGIQVGSYLEQGKLQQAEEALNEALKLSRDIDDPHLARKLDIQLGQLEIHKGNLDKALATLEAALAGAREDGDEVELCSLLTSVACIYDRMNLPDKALPLHRQALALAERTGAKHQQVDVTLNLLYCYMELGRAEEGIAAAERALQLGRFWGTDILRNNLAAALVDLGRYHDALFHYETLSTQSEDPSVLCIAWSRLVRLYTHFGQHAKKEAALEQALLYATRTEIDIARAACVIACFLHGTNDHVARATFLLNDIDQNALPSYLRDQLERALAERQPA